MLLKLKHIQNSRIMKLSESVFCSISNFEAFEGNWHDIEQPCMAAPYDLKIKIEERLTAVSQIFSGYPILKLCQKKLASFEGPLPQTYQFRAFDGWGVTCVDVRNLFIKKFYPFFTYWELLITTIDKMLFRAFTDSYELLLLGMRIPFLTEYKIWHTDLLHVYNTATNYKFELLVEQDWDFAPESSREYRSLILTIKFGIFPVQRAQLEPRKVRYNELYDRQQNDLLRVPSLAQI